jgi:hypothetical protein
MRIIAFAALVGALIICALPQPSSSQTVSQQQSFDALLNNLRQHQQTTPLGAEIEQVRRQIERCWQPPSGELSVTQPPQFRVMLNPDGTVRSAILLNDKGMDDPLFHAIADSASRALQDPRCQPLKFPADDDARWQSFTITFDNKDIK